MSRRLDIIKRYDIEMNTTAESSQFQKSVRIKKFKKIENLSQEFSHSFVVFCSLMFRDIKRETTENLGEEFLDFLSRDDTLHHIRDQSITLFKAHSSSIFDVSSLKLFSVNSESFVVVNHDNALFPQTTGRGERSFKAIS